MYAVYSFNFLETVSQQLVTQLETLEVSMLTLDKLEGLSSFQAETECSQGIYVLHLAGVPVYLGKADNVSERLRQHLKKMRGRQNISLDDVGYKVLLLDRSMGTAANEELLIRIFMERHPGNWNGGGFGSKDPGKKRDDSTPNQFDSAYPIRADFPVEDVGEDETVASLFEKMKRSLPYVFRYEVPEADGLQHVNLAGVPHTAENLLQLGVDRLGDGWRGIILSFGMIVYRNATHYNNAIREVRPRPYHP